MVVPAVLLRSRCYTSNLAKQSRRILSEPFSSTTPHISGILFFVVRWMSKKAGSWACRPDLSPREKVLWD